MTQPGWTMLLVVLALLALAGVPLLGRWALVPFALLLLALALPFARSGSGRLARAAVVAGVLGGGLGIGTASAALIDLGGVAPYGTRIGCGWAALLLAAAAAAGGALLPTRRRLAVGLLLAGSTAGSAAMALFSINTWYFAALPLCWLAAGIAALLPRPPGATNSARS
jgi:hypothetical protein